MGPGPNYKLIAIQVGDELKWVTSVNEIGRAASAVFPFGRRDYPLGSITSVRAQLIYDWIMTLAAQKMAESEKQQLLADFVDAIAPPDSKARRVLAELRTGIAAKPTSDVDRPSPEGIERLRQKLIELTTHQPQERGFEFERFLNELFRVYGLVPRSPFRLVGEQLDGSFQLDGDTYLLEARWWGAPLSIGEILAFSGKVEGKASWSRGLLVSISSFSADSLEAFRRGRSTSIVGMDGVDLCLVLEDRIHLADAIRLKARRAAETGDFFVPLMQFL